MLTPNLPDADTLILDQLDIPGKTGPVSESPKVWGINIAAALGNFPRQGLLCRAGPWTPMEIGDQIKVFWNKEVEVQQKTVGPADVNTTLQMFVPSARIPEGRAVASYSVKRLGQAWEPSEDMQVLVKLTRPGGHDDNNDPGHSKLIMRLPQDILDGGIDKDNVAAGVPVTIESYPDIAAGDVIQVSWGGVFVLSAPLTQDQADGKTPLVVHVSEAVIREAGDSDGVGLSVAFEVYDKVDNRSEDWSAAQRVVVAIDASRLEAPILKEAQSNVLDIDQLGDAPGTAQVWVTTGGSFQPGDTPIIRVKGTPVEGLPIDVEFAGEPLTSVPTTAEIPIANAVLRQMAKSQIALSYRLKKASGAPDMPSKSQFISAIGAIKRLAAPKALDAVSGALDPTLKQVRIEIPFDTSFAAGQAIKLFWLGTRPELIPYLPELPLYPLTAGDISAGKPLLIPIDGAHLTPINGGKLELYYQLLIEDAALGAMNHVNATHAIRESIHADILQVGEPRLELPEPVVAGVIDGALPGDTAGTTLTVNYLNTAKGDEVIYEWIGSKTGTKTDGITLSSLTEGKPVAFRIDAEYISGNNGGTVLAKYHIKRAAGGTSYSNALEFRVGNALENPLPIARLPQATGSGASVTLAPLDAQTGAKVIVAYAGMNDGHSIQLTVVGKPGAGSPIIPAKQGSSSGSIEFLIGPEAIAANIGNGSTTFTLSYEVTLGSNKIPSQPLTVTVTPLPAAELDKIRIEQAEGLVLDLSKVTAGATIVSGIWAFIAFRQRVKLTLTGTKNNGEALNLDVWPWPSSNVNQNWIDSGRYAHTLAYNDIKDLADGTDLELHFRAALSLSPTETDAIIAPVKRYKILAVEDLKPTITSVKDSKGIAIPQNSFTVDPNVKVSGTAARNQTILIYNNGVSTGGSATADDQGNWNRDLIGLAQGECKLTAVAQYGTGLESAEWKIIVTPLVTPTITSIKDSKGVEIPQGGRTFDTSVTITGTASKGQKVDVLDGTISKDKPHASVETGIWTATVRNLGVAVHNFTAKALYESEPVSSARTFTIIKAVSGSENWALLPLGLIPFDAPWKLSSGLTFTVRKLTTQATESEIYIPLSAPELGAMLATGAYTITEYEFGGPARKISITYRQSLDATNEIRFYNQSHALIHQENLIIAPFEIPQTLTFEHDGGCSRFKLYIANEIINGIAVTNIIWS
ncbi:hypothetical protein ACP3TY_17825 [Pseudomonas rustica]|uniref:hypothetical protein n=1 Tax=Pseudomonas rustica TaxID=2827099 RepID=UPI003CF33BCB